MEGTLEGALEGSLEGALLTIEGTLTIGWLSILGNKLFLEILEF